MIGCLENADAFIIAFKVAKSGALNRNATNQYPQSVVVQPGMMVMSSGQIVNQQQQPIMVVSSGGRVVPINNNQ